MKLCEEETNEILLKLKDEIKKSEYSMRSLCEASQKYDAPESIHHSNLSQILNQKGRNNLYIQQLFVLLNLLHIPLENFLFGSETGRLLRLINKLNPDQKLNAIQYIKRLEKKTHSD